MKKEEDTTIDEAIKKLRKQYGEDVVLSSDHAPAKVASIPSGCYAVDKLLGCGGLPRGRIIEVFGQESSGKSTFCLFLIAQIQKAGGKCVFIDAENAFDSTYSGAIGVKVEDLFVSQPSTIEETFDTIKAFVETNKIDIIVIDSVAALTPRVELEGEEILKDSVALQARLMSKGLRILTGPIARSKTVVVFINQLRDNIGVYYGNKQISPGGKALKFYSSVRLQIGRGTKILGPKEEQIGNTINITAVKNKVGFPFKKGSFDLYYGSGVDLHADAFDTAVDLEVISKDGNTYAFGDKKLGVGKDKAREILREDEVLYGNIREEIEKKLNK